MYRNQADVTTMTERLHNTDETICIPTFVHASLDVFRMLQMLEHKQSI